MPVNGTYKYEKGENIEGFLVAIGKFFNFIILSKNLAFTFFYKLS